MLVVLVVVAVAITVMVDSVDKDHCSGDGGYVIVT